MNKRGEGEEGAGGREQTPRHARTALLSTHPKANCDQGTRSGDGGSTSTTASASSWPKLGNFLIIPHGFHGTIHSHHEDRIVARSS
jgi:hypothetical protein